MAMTNLTIQIDDELIEKAESLFQDLGLDMSSAINLFVRNTIEKGRFPIDIPNYDDILDDEYFKNPANIMALEKSIKQFKKGKIVTKTMDELRAFE